MAEREEEVEEEEDARRKEGRKSCKLRDASKWETKEAEEEEEEERFLLRSKIKGN